MYALSCYICYYSYQLSPRLQTHNWDFAANHQTKKNMVLKITPTGWAPRIVINEVMGPPIRDGEITPMNPNICSPHFTPLTPPKFIEIAPEKLMVLKMSFLLKDCLVLRAVLHFRGVKTTRFVWPPTRDPMTFFATFFGSRSREVVAFWCPNSHVSRAHFTGDSLMRQKVAWGCLDMFGCWLGS